MKDFALQIAETTEAKSRLAAELEEHKEACKGTCEITHHYIFFIDSHKLPNHCNFIGCVRIIMCVQTAQMESLQQNLEKRQHRVVALEAELATLQNSLSSASLLNETTSREKACVHYRSI